MFNEPELLDMLFFRVCYLKPVMELNSHPGFFIWCNSFVPMTYDHLLVGYFKPRPVPIYCPELATNHEHQCK